LKYKKKNIILLEVLYGCETRSLTLSEIYSLIVSENGVLKRFGTERDEITGGWRKLQNWELENAYFWLNINRIMTLKRIRLAGSTYGKVG
jgi:hypothetical protein